MHAIYPKQTMSVGCIHLQPLYITVYATCNDISNDKYFVLFYQFLQYMCRTQYGCFLHFFNFVLSRCIADVFSE